EGGDRDDGGDDAALHHLLPPRLDRAVLRVGLRPRHARRPGGADVLRADRRPGAIRGAPGACVAGRPHAFSRQTAKLSAAANVTHSRYGTSSHPASARFRKNATTVAASTTQSAQIS